MSNTPEPGSSLAALLAKRHKRAARVVDTRDIYGEVMAELAREALAPGCQGDGIQASTGVRLIPPEEREG
jgi:hypothetical protein